jgi:PAS domain S-box-containing protein
MPEKEEVDEHSLHAGVNKCLLQNRGYYIPGAQLIPLATTIHDNNSHALKRKLSRAIIIRHFAGEPTGFSGIMLFWSQASWFRGVIALILLIVAFGAYRFRVKEVEKSERKFRNLAEKAQDIVMRFDEHLHYSYVNPIIEQYTGLRPEAFLGKTSRELAMPEEEVVFWEDNLLRVFTSGTPLMQEFVSHTNTGDHYFESRLVPEMESDGRVKSVLAITRDITARKQAEEALRAAQTEVAHLTRMAMMGELSASIAHEVNQPLAAIVANGNACLHWLDREVPDIAEVRKSVTRIVRDANRASDIIERIRAQIRKKEPSPLVAVDLNEVIREVRNLVHSEIVRNRISFRMELEPDLPSILGDPVELHQVLLNLIVNAIDVLGTVNDKKRLLVVTSQTKEPAESEVVIAVRDSGPGISQEKIEMLFTPFYTTKAEGMGMGLAISKSIVERHNGRIWATINEDGGMTFCIALSTRPEDQDE